MLFHDTIRRMGRQMPILLLIAAIAGFGVNWLRPDPMPLSATVAETSPLTAPDGRRIDIPLTEAASLFDAGRTVFIDARPESDYQAGHIRGARSLPWQNVDDQFMAVASELPLDAEIITYCDGAACTLSHNVALFLLDMGFENVRVLPDGWSAWKAAGLPTETGAG